MFKILSPILHSCATFGPHVFCVQKSTCKMAFFAIFGSQMGVFEGVKCALVVIHLKGCITTNLGPNLGEKKHKMCEKIVKNEKVGC